MIDFGEFLMSFPFDTWLSSAVNLVLMLAVSHWFPWSFHLGHKLTRYWAFTTGCISIVLSFGLWALMEDKGQAWLNLSLAVILFHWMSWRLPFMYARQLSRPIAYGIASFPILAVFAGWAIGAGAYVALVGLAALYAIGGIATLIFYHLDTMGVNDFDRRNDKH